jgi:hypothetical protein
VDRDVVATGGVGPVRFPNSLAVHEQWHKLSVMHSVSRVKVHDARLVAAMLVHGLKFILTFKINPN